MFFKPIYTHLQTCVEFRYCNKSVKLCWCFFVVVIVRSTANHYLLVCTLDVENIMFHSLILMLCKRMPRGSQGTVFLIFLNFSVFKLGVWENVICQKAKSTSTQWYGVYMFSNWLQLWPHFFFIQKYFLVTTKKCLQNIWNILLSNFLREPICVVFIVLVRVAFYHHRILKSVSH